MWQKVTIEKSWVGDNCCHGIGRLDWEPLSSVIGLGVSLYWLASLSTCWTNSQFAEQICIQFLELGTGEGLQEVITVLEGFESTPKIVDKQMLYSLQSVFSLLVRSTSHILTILGLWWCRNIGYTCFLLHEVSYEQLVWFQSLPRCTRPKIPVPNVWEMSKSVSL